MNAETKFLAKALLDNFAIYDMNASDNERDWSLLESEHEYSVKMLAEFIEQVKKLA